MSLGLTRGMQTNHLKHASACPPGRREGPVPPATEEALRFAQGDGYSRQFQFQSSTGGNSAQAPVARPHRSPVRRRLWLAGIGMLLCLSTLIAASCWAGPERSLLGGTHGADLIPSYMAGSFVREGRPDKLMDFPEAVRFQAHLRRVNHLEQNGRTGPWLNPPFFAWVFVPLSALPYRLAQRAWFAFNFLLFLATVVMLCRMLARPGSEFGRSGRFGASLTPIARRQSDWRTWALVPLLLITSMPFIQALASQQNTFLSFFLLTAAVWLWRKGHGLRAGLTAGLLLFKPQLAMAVAVALTCSLGRRAAIGLAITACTLLLSTALAMPGALSDYVHKLPASLPWLQNGHFYAWERQVTFQGFWRLLLQGPMTGPASLAVRLLWLACAVAAGAALLPALSGRALLRKRATLSECPDRLISASIAIMPLLMPYYMDYDLLLLAVPAVLLTAERCCSPAPLDRVARFLMIGWAILFPWLFLNAEFGAATRVSLTVPLLAAMAGLSAYRAMRTEEGRKIAGNPTG